MQPRKLVTAKILVMGVTGDKEIDAFVCPHCMVSRPLSQSGVYCGPCNRLTCQNPACIKECTPFLEKVWANA